jgi:hypothetical protein
MTEARLSAWSGDLPFAITAPRRRRTARGRFGLLLPAGLLVALAAAILAAGPGIAAICGQTGIACGP